MAEQENGLPCLQEVDIFTKQILGKKILLDTDTLWQEKYDNDNPTGIKIPFKLYILNDGTIKLVGNPVSGQNVKGKIVIYPTVTGSTRPWSSSRRMNRSLSWRGMAWTRSRSRW